MGRERTITKERFDAVLFDLDGVLTQTARVHSVAWKRTFDHYLRRRSERTGEPFRPFDIVEDYKRYVDGKLRYEGARSFLEARGIDLPWGDPSDPPEAETVCGIGNRKDGYISEAIASGAVEVYGGSVAVAREVRRRGMATAVVSASRNCREVLRAAGIEGLFDAVVDGVVAEEEGLPGKPAPDTFLRAAELLGAEPARTVVVEDAVSGVQAGRAGGFGLVIGVDHTGDPERLGEHGADIVVEDLGSLITDSEEGGS